MINLTIDKKPLQVDKPVMILTAARENGFEIPTFCDVGDLTPDGSCRVCVVEVTYPDGTRKIQPACDTPVCDGMRVRTATAAVRNARKQAAGILLSLAPDQPKIRRLAESLGVNEPIFKSNRIGPGACIHCGICVRACAEKSSGVLRFSGTGGDRRLTLPGIDPKREKRECEVCIPYCPTGALKRDLGLGIGAEKATRQRLRNRLRTLTRWLFLVLSGFAAVSTATSDLSPSHGISILARVNPFEGLVILLAHGPNRALPYLPALAVVLTTLILGRVWCGWICPTGTLLTLFGKKGRRIRYQGLRRAKTILFLSALIFALVKLTFFLYADPLALFTRFSAAIRALTLNRQPPAIDGESILRLALPFAALFLLNGIERGFYCRYLCPLGGFLGLISKFAFLKRVVDRRGCVQCGECGKSCPTGAIADDRNYISDPGECVQCGACQPDCPADAIRFEFGSPFRRVPIEFGFGRFEWIGAAALVTLITLAALIVTALFGR